MKQVSAPPPILAKKNSNTRPPALAPIEESLNESMDITPAIPIEESKGNEAPDHLNPDDIKPRAHSNSSHKLRKQTTRSFADEEFKRKMQAEWRINKSKQRKNMLNLSASEKEMQQSELFVDKNVVHEPQLDDNYDGLVRSNTKLEVMQSVMIHGMKDDNENGFSLRRGSENEYPKS